MIRFESAPKAPAALIYILNTWGSAQGKSNVGFSFFITNKRNSRVLVGLLHKEHLLNANIFCRRSQLCEMVYRLTQFCYQMELWLLLQLGRMKSFNNTRMYLEFLEVRKESFNFIIRNNRSRNLVGCLLWFRTKRTCYSEKNIRSAVPALWKGVRVL